MTGSELVGLIPKAALVSAGEHYLRKQGVTTEIPESALLHTAVRSLGLSDIAPFEIEEKVLELKLMSAWGIIQRAH